MIDVNRAQSVDHGIIVDEESTGPFYTGGTASPAGLDLPVNTVYMQTPGTGIILWKKYGAGVNDWRKYSAQDIAFDPTGTTYRATTLTSKDAFNEIRLAETLTPTQTTTTLNGTKSLVAADNTFQIIIGTATGFSVKLPDASTLNIGRSFQIINSSSEPIQVKDGAGTDLFTLNVGDLTFARLQSNGTAAGVWITPIVSASAAGITSYSIGSQTVFSTSSSTDVLITGMTVTPVSGRYALWYSADITIAQNNKLAQNVIYVGGSALERTRRVVQGVSSNFRSSSTSIAEVDVNGAQQVDVRVNIDGGSQLDVGSRRLLLIRLGA